MKEKIKPNADVGIIVGRFNVHELHSEHKDLIKTVLEKHDRVIIFLGNSVRRNTLENPLDFKSRKVMINESFPNLEVHYINDVKDDDVWSSNLDKLIREHITPIQTVMLYGSRDSFLKTYCGKYSTCELEATVFVSGTEVRRKVCNNYPPDKSYRAGMIAATAYHFPTAYQTVDIAIFNDKNELLLARKPSEKKWRFIGGFSDPKSNSLEEDAKREVLEEAGIEVSDIRYVGSTIVNDWRYRDNVDKIKTALFVAKYVYGKPEGGDDVAEVKWVSLVNGLNKNDIEDVHHILVDLLNEKVLNNKKWKDETKYFIEDINGSMP